MPDSVKIQILGASKVGKTSLMYRMSGINKDPAKVTGPCWEKYSLENRLSISILDYPTLNSENPSFNLSMIPSCINGIVLVYSCLDKNSFSYIKKLHDSLLSKGSKPLFLIGTNADRARGKSLFLLEVKEWAEKQNIKFLGEKNTTHETDIDIDFFLEHIYQALPVIQKLVQPHTNIEISRETKLELAETTTNEAVDETNIPWIKSKTQQPTQKEGLRASQYRLIGNPIPIANGCLDNSIQTNRVIKAVNTFQ